MPTNKAVKAWAAFVAKIAEGRCLHMSRRTLRHLRGRMYWGHYMWEPGRTARSRSTLCGVPLQIEPTPDGVVEVYHSGVLLYSAAVPQEASHG